ncbi:MAG: hypothetical protein AUI36_27140 [Cyanobacteria bacterium 13_1_40CM_2_61_4]|nr:MAG: hypothetical protein AUI36_27140 [Cyanobacteria bacterium 13_1_40CM_2_61_4]
MKSGNEHLEKLKSLAKQLSVGSADVTIGFMVPEFAALVVLLAERAERLHKWVRALTVFLIILTAVLVWLTCRLVYSAHF